MKAKALYDCTADDDGELSFKEGDILVDVIESKEEGWYEGRVQGTSIRGLFPFNYAEFVSEPTTASKAIPRHSTSDSSKTFGGHSVSPPNSTLSSTWSVISTKDQDNDDAFDKAMQAPLKPMVGKLDKPSVAPKPSQLKKPVSANNNNNNKKTTPLPVVEQRLPTTPLMPLANAPSVASRVRSLSTSATVEQAPVKLPSLFKNEQDRKAMPIIRPKPYIAKPAVQERTIIKKDQPERVIFDSASVNENEDDMEDVDGYQLVRPSQVRQRQAGAMVIPKAMPTLARVNFKPASIGSSSPPSSGKFTIPPIMSSSPVKSSSMSMNSVSSPPRNMLDSIPAGSSPAPRLPSRPISKAGRRPRSSKSSTTSSTPETLTKPPNPKPKPSQFSAISPQRAKGRSVSNPPPIQPKPFISKLNNGNKPDVPLSSKPESMRKPPPAPATASKTTPAVPLRPAQRQQQQQQQQQQQSSKDTNVKPSELLNRTRSKSNGWAHPVPPVLPARAPAVVKKTPPPPPPSRPVQRYEDLFGAIHDDGYVDAQTAKIIWKRSKLSDEMLAKIWEHCDPRGSGLLDKNAFIQGMREIDALLGQLN